jgi:hypothetical protein
MCRVSDSPLSYRNSTFKIPLIETAVTSEEMLAVAVVEYTVPDSHCPMYMAARPYSSQVHITHHGTRSWIITYNGNLLMRSPVTMATVHIPISYA